MFCAESPVGHHALLPENGLMVVVAPDRFEDMVVVALDGLPGGPRWLAWRG